MTVCYFGIYRAEYIRNRCIIAGLRKVGVTVIEVQDRSKGLRKYFRLFRKHWLVRKKYDIMIVGFSGQLMTIFAKALTLKPVILDAMVSLYDGAVIERKQHTAGSMKGRLYFFIDWLALRMADKVLIDTHEHVKYFVKLFNVPAEKFVVVYHGCDIAITPDTLHRSSSTFIVEFHGLITPTNGMEFVIHAMKQLEHDDIVLLIIGGGQEYARMQNLATVELKLSNIVFFPFMQPVDLYKKISEANCGIGFFNEASGRVQRVIPNKIYEMMALKIPVVTADTPAIRELFVHKEQIYLCPAGNSAAIAKAFTELRDNAILRASIADKAYSYFNRELIPEAVGSKLKPILEKLLKY